MKKVLILAAVLCFQFCARDTHPDYFGTIRPKHPLTELWINGGNEPQTLDPHKMNGDPEINILVNMFVRLVQSNPQTGEIVPDLAKSWDISEDGREYTFHLREDAKWSDGKPITAQDVEWSWKRLIDPKTGSVSSSLADIIENAAEFRKGKASKESIGITAVDDRTLLVKLRAPVSYFLGQIEYIAFAPLPKHLIEKLQSEKKEDQWTKPQNIVVSGAFKLTEDRFKQDKVFEKNPSYYNADKVRLQKVKSFVIESYNADLNAYRTGQHDWSCCNSLPPESLDNLRAKKDFHIDPYLATYFFMTNTTKKPMNNALVRKALSLAIDRQSLVDNVTRGGQIASRDFVPTGTLGYAGIQSTLYDPDGAKKLLAKAGYPNGKNFPKLGLKFNTSEVHRMIAEAVQQMWKKNLNIDVELVNVEWSVFMDDQKSGNFQITRRAWIGDYIDPYTFLSVPLSDGTNNKSGWKNKKYDQLIAASNLERDQAKRFKIFQEAEKILAEEQPYLPLYFYTRPYMKKPFLRGFWPHLQNHHEWKYMYIDPRWADGVPQGNEPDDKPWF